VVRIQVRIQLVNENRTVLDRLCVSSHRKLDADRPLDLGALGEAMLFYGEVRLISNRAVLTQLIRDLSIADLFTSLSEGYLRITYVDGGFGVLTENTGTPFERYRPITYQSDVLDFDAAADLAFTEKTGSDSKGRKLRRKLSPFVQFHRWDGDVVDAVKQDLARPDFVNSSANAVVAAAAPDVHNLARTFRIEPDGDFLRVTTDIDFVKVNSSFHQRVSPGVTSIAPAQILAEIVEGRAQLQYAAEYEGEISTDVMTTQILQLKCEEVIGRSSGSQKKIDLFQDRALEGRAVRESINSGQRSFADLLTVIGKGRRFRDWVASREDDRDLLDAYYQEVTRLSWVDRLPVKSVRWAVFGSTGIALAEAGVPQAGPIAMGIGAFDALLLDRLARGWRPNQFVENKLTRFVKD
jgi:hypothetical protein